MERRNKSGWSIIFTDHDNKPIDEDNDEDYDPNNDPNSENYYFDLNEYVTENFPARVNDGEYTYANTYKNC